MVGVLPNARWICLLRLRQVLYTLDPAKAGLASGCNVDKDADREKEQIRNRNSTHAPTVSHSKGNGPYNLTITKHV
jgi:hypothetical protein